MNADVLILGAGAAGLAAAGALSAAGLRTIIVESRDRVGGRIHTCHDPAFPIPIELGAEFIHGRPRSTWNLIRQAKIPAIDVPSQHWMRQEDSLRRVGDFGAQLRSIMSRLDRLGAQDMSFTEFLQRYCAEDDLAAARDMAVWFVQGFDAADPQRISAKALALEQQGPGDVEGQPQFRLLGGYGRMIDHMAGSLDRQRVRMVLGTTVQQVRWRRHQVEMIAVNSSSEAMRFTGRAAVITLPVGVLQLEPSDSRNGAATLGAVRFEPELPAKRAAAKRLGCGPVLKIVLKFRDAFWERTALIRDARNPDGSPGSLENAVFMHDPHADLPTWWTALPLRVPVLTAWAGGPVAERLSGLAEAEQIDRALAALAGMLGVDRTIVDEQFEAARIGDWLADPLARGAYSYAMVDALDARRALMEPVQGTLHFAGEAADDSDQASTVAGALRSGERAAAEVYSALRSGA